MQFSNRTSDGSHQCWRRVYTTLFIILVLLLGTSAEFKRSTGAPVFVSGAGIRLVDFHVGCDPRSVVLFDSLSTWKENVTFSMSIDNSQFLVFHFTYLHLPLQASLTIWDQDEYEQQDRALSRAHQQYNHTTTTHHFYTHPLRSKRAIVEYVVHTQPTDGQCYGFRIDEVRFAAQSIYRGTQSRLQPTRRQLFEVNMNAESDEYDANGKNVAMGDLLVYFDGADALGGDVNANTCVTSSDSSEEAACIRYNAGMFESSRSVVRLLVHKEMGSIFCTGWLLGCQGHIITNHHCISNSDEANATVIEFLAQGERCRERCDEPMGCPGIIEATSSTIIASSPINELDYTLLLPRLPPSKRFSLIQKYGYLTLRSSGVEQNERIFIPQHPSGFGKRIAMKHNNAFGEANAVNQTGCNSLQRSVGYLLDTRGGSSGSPVIAYKDKAVIGLHYCGGCLNLAIPSEYIVRSLIHVNKLPRCAQSIFPGPSPPSNMDEIDINEYEAS